MLKTEAGEFDLTTRFAIGRFGKIPARFDKLICASFS
jgi:hypothetical protein